MIPALTASDMGHRVKRKFPFRQTKWYAREDSNLHPLRDRNLNPARLPIPPLARRACFRRNWPFGQSAFFIVTPMPRQHTALPCVF